MVDSGSGRANKVWLEHPGVRLIKYIFKGTTTTNCTLQNSSFSWFYFISTILYVFVTY